MKGRIFILFSFVPSYVFAQNQVAPEGYKLLLLIGLIVLIVAGSFLFRKLFSKRNKGSRKNIFQYKRKKINIILEKDRLIRPKVLTLRIKNTGSRVIDIEAPVLIFKKLWSKRKFKLKKINNREIYPFYLEVGHTHTVTIDLTRFFEHDRKLKRFYWGRIILTDVDGKKFKSKRVSLRKSLYS